MKLQITLCLFLCLALSHPGKIRQLSPTETIPHCISLIDRYWESGDYLYLKLPEIEGTLYISKHEHPDHTKNIVSAFSHGLPLQFSHKGHCILSVCLPTSAEVQAYLATYPCIGKLNIDSVKSRCNSQNCYSFAYFRKSFFQFLKDSFAIEKRNYPLDYGCEARAGVIAKFLDQCLNIKNYKLFIDGHIQYPCKNTVYTWVGHTLNIIPARRGKKTELFVFDPFSLEKWVSLEGFLKLLADNGSSELHYHLTDPSVFVSYRQYDKGVLDKGFFYSGMIFRSICGMNNE
jgi:hypothetical protein